MIWIRGQERTSLIEVSHVRMGVYANDENTLEYKIIYDTSDVMFDLGTYSTEEKALKVLDMIQKIIVDNGYMEAGMPRVFSPQHCVFEMPADEEVAK